MKREHCVSQEDDLPERPNQYGARPFPDGTRPRHPSDFRPKEGRNTVHNQGIVIRDSYLFTFLFSLKDDECKPTVIPEMTTAEGVYRDIFTSIGYFVPPEVDSPGIWRFIIQSDTRDHAKREFFERTKKLKVESLSESSEPLGKRPMFRFFIEPVTNSRRRKIVRSVAPTAGKRVFDPELGEFIGREAAKRAKGDPNLRDDLIQEAYLRLIEVADDDIEVLKAVAVRAIDAAAKRSEYLPMDMSIECDDMNNDEVR